MISVSRRTVRGRTLWCVDERGATRSRRFFKSEAEATQWATSRRREREDVGRSLDGLSPAERLELAQILAEIRSAGRTLRDVWAAAQATPHTASVSLGEALADMTKAKAEAGRRALYIRSLGWYVGPFVRGRESQPVSAVTSEDVREHLGCVRGGADHKATTLARLGSFFSHCIRRGWIEKNPCDRVDRIRIDRRAPDFLTPEEVRRVMEWAKAKRPDALAFLTLSIFCGLRPGEVERIGWDAVGEVIVVGAEASKIRRRRIVTPHPTACAWLAICDRSKPVCPPSPRGVKLQLRAILGRWQADILRHTAATYLVELHHDAARVALMLGNSPGILLTHYRGLVSSQDCAEFWKILPS